MRSISRKSGRKRQAPIKGGMKRAGAAKPGPKRKTIASGAKAKVGAKKASARKVVTKKGMAKKPTIKRAVPKKAVPKKKTTKRVAARKVVAKKAASGKATSNKATPRATSQKPIAGRHRSTDAADLEGASPRLSRTSTGRSGAVFGLGRIVQRGFQGHHNRGTPRSYEADGLSADGREHPEDMETGISVVTLADDAQSPWGTLNNESLDQMDGRSSGEDVLDDLFDDEDMDEDLLITGRA